MMSTFTEFLQGFQISRSCINLSVVYRDGCLKIDVLPGKQNYIYIKRLANKDATVFFQWLDDTTCLTLALLHRGVPLHDDSAPEYVSFRTNEFPVPCFTYASFRYDGRTVVYYPEFAADHPRHVTLGRDIRAVATPLPRVHLEVHCGPSAFWQVVASLLRAFEELEQLHRPLLITVTDFSWKEEQTMDEISFRSNLAWAAVEPFVGGIVSAFRADRRVTPTSDELSVLLLDRRLIRTKGALMSSFMAGAVVPFLPAFP
jgi:hypothetical protein